MTIDKAYAKLGATEPIIRASWVKRFHLLPMAVSQNIAEHQWNVTMLFLTAWPMTSDQQKDKAAHPLVAQSIGMQWALVHDLPEVYTGDLPTHIKHLTPSIKQVLNGVEQAVMPGWWNEIADIVNKPEYALVKQLVKACDIADTLRGCRYVQNPAARDWVQYSMKERFDKAIEGLPPRVTDMLREYYLNG